MSNNEVLEKREQVRNKKITMTRAAYVAKIRAAFNRGQILALSKVGFPDYEIAEFLGIPDSDVNSVLKEDL